MLNFRGPGWEQLRADYAKLRVHSRRRRICHNQHHICNTPSDRAEVSWRYGDWTFCISKWDHTPSDFHSASLQLMSRAKSLPPKAGLLNLLPSFILMDIWTGDLKRSPKSFPCYTIGKDGSNGRSKLSCNWVAMCAMLSNFSCHIFQRNVYLERRTHDTEYNHKTRILLNA